MAWSNLPWPITGVAEAAGEAGVEEAAEGVDGPRLAEGAEGGSVAEAAGEGLRPAEPQPGQPPEGRQRPSIQGQPIWPPFRPPTPTTRTPWGRA